MTGLAFALPVTKLHERLHTGQSPTRTGLMAGTKVKLSPAVEAYFTNLGRVRASVGAIGERSAYGPLAGLLNAVGSALKPKVFASATPRSSA